MTTDNNEILGSAPRSNNLSDPFHSLQTELLALILGHLTSRERCYLRLQSAPVRRFVDKYEQARSIDLYVRDGARVGEPWGWVLGLARVDLRESLTSLACRYENLSTKSDDCQYILEIVAKRLQDLLSETMLDIKAPAPPVVINAILDLHHVQCLLADEERRGLGLDEELIAAQKAVYRRLVAIYGLQKHVIWPLDTTAWLSPGNSPLAFAEIEEATDP